MDIYAILSTKEHVERQLKIYVKYINRCAVLNENLPTDTYTELHHICPRVFFPEYKNLKDHPWNGIRLTIGQHFTAHLILSNAYTFNGAMSQAFYLMCTQNGSKDPALVNRFKTLKTYYEDARNLVINAQRGLTMVKNKETGVFGLIPVEEYKANPDLYETATTGMVTVRDLETDEIKSISSEMFYANKDKYAAMNAGIVQVTDKLTGEKLRISSEVYQANKEKYTTAASGFTLVRDKTTDEVLRIPVDTYANNKDRYESVVSGTTTAKLISTGEMVVIPVETYHANRDLYETATTGFLSAKNKLTGETVRISSTEYAEHRNLYQSLTSGMVTTLSRITGEKTRISKEEFENNPDLYVKAAKTRSIYKVGTYLKPINYIRLSHETSIKPVWVYNPSSKECKLLPKEECVGIDWLIGELPTR